ncbi:hypothetical protein TSUD_82180 [Trifolium subterraneum]|uniref:chitinase n=1 Tax=Trifolium subterraneum TaxID=3900 RepID=A0A2Z6P4H2_TRISU|nr:hypothetical protein TSUD_82180 [Trifolium subterraneum]
MRFATVTLILLVSIIGCSLAQQCGRQVGGAQCPGGSCCSKYGWCGSNSDYCGDGCQSQCGGGRGSVGESDLGSLISRDTFNNMLNHRDDNGCQGKGFYSYDAFISAAKAFPDFANHGDIATRKREIAAFFGQTSHETTGGWPTAPDGPNAWGYCYVTERTPNAYCQPSFEFVCNSLKRYYGRGPIQITWNYNYGQCGRAIGVDLLNNPDLVANDAVISFKTALWFWMTPQITKPSCHDVITGRWSPSNEDLEAGRFPGYGTVTNIINGGLECGIGVDTRVQDRIRFYKRYCDMFGLEYGDKLACFSQAPFFDPPHLSSLPLNTIATA